MSESNKAGQNTVEATRKDLWDKWGIALSSIGAILLPIVLAIGGYLASEALDKRQARDANNRLKVQLLGDRRGEDNIMRRDMFQSILSTFLDSRGHDDLKMLAENQVLALELLARNFHEFIDIGPLFKHVRQLVTSDDILDNEVLLARMTRIAREVKDRQISALGDVGSTLSGTYFFEDLDLNQGYFKLMDDTLRLPGDESVSLKSTERHFKLEVVDANLETQEIRVRLLVFSTQDRKPRIDRVLTVGLFNFPMVNSMRLSHEERCSVVVTRWGPDSAELQLLYFPATYAAMREKFYQDEAEDAALRLGDMNTQN